MIILKMKKCNKCCQIKKFSEFHKHRLQKDGYNTLCKECRKPITEQYYYKNRDEINKKQQINYYKNHEKNLKKDRERIKKERVKRNLKSKEYYINNLEKVKEYHKKYYQKNKNRIIEKSRKWCEENKELYLKSRRERIKERKNNDIFFKLKCKLKTDIYISIRRKKRNKRLEDILGVSIENFKKHIEYQFEEWMTWDNWGKSTWHIDHIIPLCSAKDENEIYELWYYTNMRPISAIENLKKGGKLIL